MKKLYLITRKDIYMFLDIFYGNTATDVGFRRLYVNLPKKIHGTGLQIWIFVSIKPVHPQKLFKVLLVYIAKVIMMSICNTCSPSSPWVKGSSLLPKSKTDTLWLTSTLFFIFSHPEVRSISLKYKQKEYSYADEIPHSTEIRQT